MGSNINAIEAQFFQSLATAGITPKGNLQLIPDGKIHRFSTEEDKRGEYSGGYYIHADGWPNWGVQDFRKHDEMQKFKLERRDIKDSDIPKINAMIEESRARAEQRKRENAEKEIEAISKARIAYETAQPNYGHPFNQYNKHPYLIAKHINFTGVKDYDGDRLGHSPRIKISPKNGDKILLVPLFSSITGEFRSLQWIAGTPNQGKYARGFYPGISIKGLCAELIPVSYRYSDGELDYRFKPAVWERTEIDIYICEGIATGFSILELTEYKTPVICAMTCHNIMHVAQGLKERLKDFKMRITITADNDEAGLKAAKATVNAGFADEIKAPPHIKGFNGTDWNDYINFMKGLIK